MGLLDGLFGGSPQQPQQPGLLSSPQPGIGGVGGLLSDPNATYALISQLFGAKKGEGLAGLGRGLQGAVTQAQQDQQLAQQRALAQQQLALGNINLQTQTRAFQDSQAARDILRGAYAQRPAQPPPQSPPPSQLPQMSTPDNPQFNVPPPQGSPPQAPPTPMAAPGGGQMLMQPPASAGQGKFDTFNKYNSVADQLEQAGLIDQAKTFRDMAEKFRPELKDTKTLVDPRTNQRVTVNFYKDGTREVVPFSPDMEKAHFADTGNAITPLDAFSGKPVGAAIPKAMTPGENASNAIARQNLVYRQMEVDPFGMLGTPQVPGAGGAAPQRPGITPPPAGTPPVGPDTHGDEFLQSLPPQVANQVKALAEGRQAFPSGMALRHPAMQQLIGLVSQYDPNFDAVNYQARNATRKAFTSGKEADNLKALNTAVGHLDSLNTSMGALNNFGGVATPLNAPVNALQSAFGDPRQKDFAVKQEAVSNELAKVFRTSGMSQGEISRWQATLSQNQSPAQQQAVVKGALDLMQSRINALGDTYNKGMGTTGDGLQLLSPKSQQTFQKLLGNTGTITAGDGTPGFKVLGKE